MAGFFGENPESTVVGNNDATENAIVNSPEDQTDTAGGFYQASPVQTAIDTYTKEAFNWAGDAETSATLAGISANASSGFSDTSLTNAINSAGSAFSSLGNANSSTTSAAASAGSATSAAGSATSAASAAAAVASITSRDIAFITGLQTALDDKLSDDENISGGQF